MEEAVVEGTIVRKPNGQTYKVSNPNDPDTRKWLADAEIIHQPDSMAAAKRGFERGVSTTIRGIDQLAGTNVSGNFYEEGEDRKLEDEYRRYRESNPWSAMGANFAGNVVDPVGALLPGGLLAKGARALGAGRVLAGAAAGAGMGAAGGVLDPVYEEYGDSRALNTAVGTVAGGGLGGILGKFLGKSGKIADEELDEVIDATRKAPEAPTAAPQPGKVLPQQEVPVEAPTAVSRAAGGVEPPVASRALDSGEEEVLSRLTAEGEEGISEMAGRYKMKVSDDAAQIGRRVFVDPASGEPRPLTYGMLKKLSDPNYAGREEVLKSIYGADPGEEDTIRKLFSVAQNRLKGQLGSPDDLETTIRKLSDQNPDALEILKNRPKTGALSEAEANVIAGDVVKATQEMPVLVAQVGKMLNEGVEMSDAALKTVVEQLNKNAAVMLMWQGNKRAASRTLNQLKRVKAAQLGSKAELDSIFGGFKC